eukprot:748712-Hanusia_phi.AAC.5
MVLPCSVEMGVEIFEMDDCGPASSADAQERREFVSSPPAAKSYSMMADMDSLLGIMMRLDEPRHLWLCAQVCRSWEDATSSEELWRHVFYLKFGEAARRIVEELRVHEGLSFRQLCARAENTAVLVWGQGSRSSQESSGAPRCPALVGMDGLRSCCVHQISVGHEFTLRGRAQCRELRAGAVALGGADGGGRGGGSADSTGVMRLRPCGSCLLLREGAVLGEQRARAARGEQGRTVGDHRRGFAASTVLERKPCTGDAAASFPAVQKGLLRLRAHGGADGGGGCVHVGLQRPGTVRVRRAQDGGGRGGWVGSVSAAGVGGLAGDACA